MIPRRWPAMVDVVLLLVGREWKMKFDNRTLTIFEVQVHDSWTKSWVRARKHQCEVVEIWNLLSNIHQFALVGRRAAETPRGMPRDILAGRRIHISGKTCEKSFCGTGGTTGRSWNELWKNGTETFYFISNSGKKGENSKRRGLLEKGCKSIFRGAWTEVHWLDLLCFRGSARQPD